MSFLDWICAPPQERIINGRRQKRLMGKGCNYWADEPEAVEHRTACQKCGGKPGTEHWDPDWDQVRKVCTSCNYRWNEKPLDAKGNP